MSDAKLTVYFDGACPLCQREIAFYRRQRGSERITWHDISCMDTEHVAPGLSRESALRLDATKFEIRLDNSVAVTSHIGADAAARSVHARRVDVECGGVQIYGVVRQLCSQTNQRSRDVLEKPRKIFGPTEPDT